MSVRELPPRGTGWRSTVLAVVLALVTTAAAAQSAVDPAAMPRKNVAVLVDAAPARSAAPVASPATPTAAKRAPAGDASVGELVRRLPEPGVAGVVALLVFGVVLLRRRRG
jgi:hypothetical protein